MLSPITNADRRERICSEGLTPLCLKNRDLQGSHLILGSKTAYHFLACTISHAPTPNRCSLKNASRSALIWSALVVGMPCGKPGYTFSVAFLTIFADIRAAAPIGTI